MKKRTATVHGVLAVLMVIGLAACSSAPPPQAAMAAALHAAVSGHATAALSCATNGFVLRGPGQPPRSADATRAWLASLVFPVTGHAVASLSSWRWSHRGVHWFGRVTLGFAAMGGPIGPRAARVRIAGEWVKRAGRWRCLSATWSWPHQKQP